jgi:glyoxylase-like metal-dependent hydrolase (beta-lactamase superfamily II)
VVDVGFPSSAKTILNFVQNTLGRNAGDIKLIVITHSHIDHVGGVDYLVVRTHGDVAAYINAEKYLMGTESIPIAKCKKLREFLDFLRKHNFPRPSISDVFLMTWAGIPGIKKGIRSQVTHWLVDGDPLPNHPEWKVIHTPGHTDDKSLITGDTIINLQGQLTLNPLLTIDNEALLESLEKLKQLQVDEVYPGWGSPVLKKDVINHI